MHRHLLRIIQRGVWLLDLVWLNGILLFTYLRLELIHRTDDKQFAFFWVWLNVSWALINWIGKFFGGTYSAAFERFPRRTIHLYIYWLLGVLMYLVFAQVRGLSQVYVFIIVFGQGMAILLNRFLYVGILTYFSRNYHLTHKVVIVGFNELAKKLASYLEAESVNNQIVGFCEDREKVKELSDYPILGPVNKAIEYSKLYHVSDIYSTISPEQNFGIYKIIEQADQMCIHFQLVPDLSFFIKRSVHVRYLRDIPVLTLRNEPLMDIENRIIKRAFDIVLGFLVISFVLSWMIPLLSVLIFLESGGPVFFIQQRTGRNNKPFACIKFRSMKVNKESDIKQAVRNDARITRIGRLLRRTNLDEFPQFINVLKGEMSIVGPRPHMLNHTNTYSKLINQYMVRQFLKPGITGWAQVNGFRGETKEIGQMQGRVEHDIWYMENWNFWLDIRIIFLTFYTTIRGNENAC